jgi:hypothetical protein
MPIFLLCIPDKRQCDPTQDPSTFISPGNAASLLLWIIAACVTQPPGSLILHNCDRFWRAHPLFAAWESVVIYMSLAWHVVLEKRPLRVVSHALLAMRLQRIRNSGADRSDQTRLAKLVEEVPRQWERGILLQTVIAFPMALLAIKLCFFRGHMFTTIAAFCYLSSWTAVELLSFFARCTDKALTEEELQAVKEVLVDIEASTVPKVRDTVVFFCMLGDAVRLPLCLDTALNLAPKLKRGLGIFMLLRSILMMVVPLMDVIIIPSMLALLLKLFSNKPKIAGRAFPVAHAANWIAFRTVLFILLYYGIWYKPCVTWKPSWIDWLG